MNDTTTHDATVSDAARSLRSLDQHGPALHHVASALTADAGLAAKLVVRAVLACRHDDVDPGLRELSSLVVLGWLGRPSQLPTDTVPLPSLLQDVHALPDDQRALLALCRFGAHTYRDAARVLTLSADGAAVLLCTALRTLQAPEVVPLTA